jgi:hypothetical protein
VNDDDDRTGHFAALDGGFRRCIDLREFGAIRFGRTNRCRQREATHGK